MSQVPEWSLSGLHDVVWDLLCAAIGKSGGCGAVSVLDVGAGPGEFSSRLVQAGYVAVACDRDPSVFRGSCSRYVACDLNADWRSKLQPTAPFDAIVAQEVIEHIENPWQFVRGMGELLKPGGVLIVTSPNNQDMASRIDYLFNGELPWFRLGSLQGNGHQTPIFIEQMCLMAITAGFDLKGYYGYGKRAPLKLNWRGRLFERYLARRMRGHSLGNVINVWVLQMNNTKFKGNSHLSPDVINRSEEWLAVPCRDASIGGMKTR